MERIACQPTWVFGMVDACFQPSRLYRNCPSERETHWQLTHLFIRMNGEATKTICRMYQHVSYTINQTCNFLDPSTSVHTHVSLARGYV